MNDEIQRAITNADAARIVGLKYREGHECDLIALADEVLRLRAAIETHRAQKADDRCIEDDDTLYEALGDGIKCDRRVGDKYLMLANCARFIDQRCEGGKWRSYMEIERELNDAHEALTICGAPPRYYNEVLKPSGLLVPATRTLSERIRAITEVDTTNGDQPDGTAFSRAVAFAQAEGYRVQSGAGSYIEWRYIDRDRALLTLLGKDLLNLRGIRIPIPTRIT